VGLLLNTKPRRKDTSYYISIATISSRAMPLSLLSSFLRNIKTVQNKKVE